MTTIFDVPGSNPPNPFSATIQALVAPSNDLSSAPETVAGIVTTVTNSPDPAHALWELWDAFFIAVATSSTSHTSLLALLDALRAQESTQPGNVPKGSDAERQLKSYVGHDGKLHWRDLPRFSAQWRDVHDILEAWRDWDGVRASGATASGSGDKCYLNFCVFSAALLKTAGEVHPVRVFYACHDVLERSGPEPRQQRAHRMSTEQVWALDVRLAATWVRDGGRALWETDHEELRRHWAAALDEKTELWPKEDGLTRERWRLWGDRLRALSTGEGGLDEVARTVAAEAAAVVEDILGQDSV